MPGDELIPAPGRDPRPAVPGEDLARLAAAAASYAEASRSPATRRAYDAKWRAFTVWCDSHRAVALPADPDVICLYLAELAASRKVSTLNQILAAIGDAHRRADLIPPSSSRLTEVWSGIRRARAVAPDRRAALVTAELRKVVQRLPATMAGARDRAILLIGFSGALRRSELVALELGERSAASRCIFVAGGLHLHLAKSKTDQEGHGHLVAIPKGKTKLCPVSALRAWLELSQISSGPIFREVDRHGRVGETRLSDRAVADVVKRAVLRAGLDPVRFSGHSLRAGFVTSAAQAGVTTELIMRQTRHTKAETVAGYVREAELFSRNAASKVGL